MNTKDNFQTVVELLGVRVGEVVDKLFTALAEEEDARMRAMALREELTKLKIAYEALSGKTVDVPILQEQAPEVPVNRHLPSLPLEPPLAPAPSKPRGPACRSCGGGPLVHEYRELSNGRLASLLVCHECKSESPA